MTPERIDIVIAESRVAADEEHRQLLAAAQKRQRPARVPALLARSQWFALGARGGSVAEYLRGPRENLRGQLLNLKWKTENIPDDQPLPLREVVLTPDLGSIRGTQFPMVWRSSDAGPMVADALLTDPEQIDSLQMPAPDGGMNATRIQWYRAMAEMADNFDLRVNGQRVAIKVTLSHGGGPIPTAFALAGHHLFEWMALEPERVHRLMDLITRSEIQCSNFFDELVGRKPRHSIWLGCDSAEMISPEMFREFVVPSYLRMWEAFPGKRSLHMCGRINHLLEILRDELRIDILDGFGFPVPPELLAEKLAGRMALKGGFSPMLLHSGPLDAIRKECRRYLDLLAPAGGYIFTPGGAVLAGTPPEHFQAVLDMVRD